MTPSLPLAWPDLQWHCSRFDALTPRALQYIYMARQRVFSLEQDCVYLDADGFDECALHLAAWTGAQREPLAYARIVEPGVKYAEPSIGRVITTPPARGSGLGRALVRRAVAECRTAYPAQGIRISAQQRLDGFYAAAGFVAVGEPYLEDGIPHLEMLLPPG